MNLSDKMSYLKGLVDGMELDLTTKEGSCKRLPCAGWRRSRYRKVHFAASDMQLLLQERNGFVCNGFTGSGR